MSRNSYSKNKGGTEKKEEKEEAQGEDEHFYESIDRIASSSCSCSASNSDSDPDLNPTHSNDLSSPIPNFPMGVAKYDVWVSEPESVSERRQRLLLQMGLSVDPPLSDGSDHLTQEQPGPSSSGPIFRSKSDGGGSRADRADNGHKCNDDFNLCSCYCPQILSHDSINLNNDKDNTNVVTKKAAAVSSPLNKPPSGKKMDVNRSDSTNSGEFVDGFDCNGKIVVDAITTIKNLDNGTQFVVNEIKEDGTWNKLKEVGTGRQLTMEEFEISVGHSPIVQELMRRQNVEDGENLNSNTNLGVNGEISKHKKKGNWFKTIKSVATSVKGHKERSSDEGSEKGGRRSSSATDDSQDVSFHGPERVRVRQYGKSFKELSGLYKSQEIQAHNGSIWSIKFSLDGRYLASAGEDSVIYVWRVTELDRRGELLIDKGEDGNFNLFLGWNGSPEGYLDGHCEKKRRGRNSISRKSLSLDHHILVPETVFGLTDKPICSFMGHQDDVLDLSWSKSQHLLSSSMDKTVRLWHLSSNSCLKTFSHSDYVTCIQFNPVDDQYFISGSLDAKVRIWSIPDHQVVDWSDLHEMVTAACYTPDGQGALVGTYKGTCRLYTATENKLQQKCEINLQNKKKKVHLRKITGFQFARGGSSEVLITSADSRIRVIDGIDMVHKFKGFRTTNSPISASLTSNGKYVVSASEDSYVYIWNHEADSRPSRGKAVNVTRSYEHFHCQDISTAIPWPGMGVGDEWPRQGLYNQLDEVSSANHPPTPVQEMSYSPLNGIICSATNGYFFDRISATWPEEKLTLATRTKSRTPRWSFDFCNGVDKKTSAAYGMVIVTAGLGGEIRSYQNFGLGVRI